MGPSSLAPTLTTDCNSAMEGQLDEDVVVSNNVAAGALDLKLSESGHSEKATEGKILNIFTGWP